jgi:plastocyanin
VHVEPGDVLRSNATYDTTIQSTYENMGIAVALLAPDQPDGTPTAPGIDPFDPAVPFDPSPNCDSGGINATPPTLCDKGIPTHGHLPENDNFGGPQGDTLEAGSSGPTDRVDIGAFLYVPGDLSMLSMGIPSATPGQQVRFTNLDSAVDVYHSVTSCAYPCTGPTGTSFPVSNGATSTGRAVDFDSGELGFGIPSITAAKNTIEWDLDLTGYEPGEVVTYFCRIHPFMRGALEVTAQ